MKLGLIGLDTSHVIAFADMFNDPEHHEHVPGARVVAGYKGGSDTFAPSYERVDNFTQQLVEKWDLTIYDTIEELCEAVDGILLTSVDGRQHLEQARPVIQAGLPIFVDKPFTNCLAEGIELAELAKANNVPMFSTSSLRYLVPEEVASMAKDGNVHGIDVAGPAGILSGMPDLFWYGIHGIEILFSVMGPGCIEVTRTYTDGYDVVVGRWEDGRLGVYRGIRKGAAPFRITVYGEEKVLDQELEGSYRKMLVDVLETIRTGDPAVNMQETLEILAFMEAADVSKEKGGVPVKMEDMFKAAREK